MQCYPSPSPALHTLQNYRSKVIIIRWLEKRREQSRGKLIRRSSERATKEQGQARYTCCPELTSIGAVAGDEAITAANGTIWKVRERERERARGHLPLTAVPGPSSVLTLRRVLPCHLIHTGHASLAASAWVIKWMNWLTVRVCCAVLRMNGGNRWQVKCVCLPVCWASAGVSVGPHQVPQQIESTKWKEFSNSNSSSSSLSVLFANNCHTLARCSVPLSKKDIWLSSMLMATNTRRSFNNTFSFRKQ